MEERQLGQVIEGLIILCIVIINPPLVKSQCYEDFFGYWRAETGEFITLIKPDTQRRIEGKTVIGNKSVEYKCVHFYENRVLKMINYPVNGIRKSNSDHDLNKSFEYEILKVDKQAMTIQPISNEMKSIFGESKVTLYNENYISFDQFKLDSIYFSRLHSPYILEISENGLMKLTVNPFNEKRRKKIYTASLKINQLSELKELVQRSKITHMSICELKVQCLDCYPLRLKIYHNNINTEYNRGIMHDSVVPLWRFFKSLIEKSKWKKLKR